MTHDTRSPSLGFPRAHGPRPRSSAAHALGWLALALATLLSTACTVDRASQLRSKADRVESALEKERDRLVALNPDAPERSARLNHLTTLRNELSAANIGLGTVRLLPPDTRDTAYDVLDQAYDTIKWNIPLGPSDPQRAMPSQFSNGVLRLN